MSPDIFSFNQTIYLTFSPVVQSRSHTIQRHDMHSKARSPLAILARFLTEALEPLRHRHHFPGRYPHWLLQIYHFCQDL